MNSITSINQRQDNPWLTKVLCIGLLMQGLTGCEDAEKPFPRTGETFPLSAFEQLTRVGKSDIGIEGKTLLINFWATWCAPCREEMPLLQKLSDDLDPGRFAVIGISVDDDLNLIREFLLQYEIRFANLQDNNFWLASELLGIKTFPVTFIVSPDGVITRRISEALPPDFSVLDQSVESGEQAGNIKSDSRMKG